MRPVQTGFVHLKAIDFWFQNNFSILRFNRNPYRISDIETEVIVGALFDFSVVIVHLIVVGLTFRANRCIGFDVGALVEGLQILQEFNRWLGQILFNFSVYPVIAI